MIEISTYDSTTFTYYLTYNVTFRQLVSGCLGYIYLYIYILYIIYI